MAYTTWQQWKTVIACLCLIITFVWTCYNAVLSHSIALICALSHMILTLLLLIFYIINHNYIVVKQQPRATYRMWMIERTFILASGLIFSFAACLLLVLSVLRLLQPVTVDVDLILQTGLIILICNIICSYLLSSKKSSTQAFIRYLLRTDISNAIIVLLVSLTFIKWDIHIIDEILAMILAMTLFKQSYQILNRSLVMMTEGTKEQRQLAAIQGRLYSLSAVIAVSNMQLWTVIGEEMTLSCRITLTADAHVEAVEQEILTLLKKEYQIMHSAIIFVQQKKRP